MAAKISSRRAKKIRERLSGEQNHRCCYCGIVTTLEPGFKHSATIEHVNDKRNGGTNAWINLAMACFDCNTTRQEISPEEFKKVPLDTYQGRRIQELKNLSKAFQRTGNVRLLESMVIICPCFPEKKRTKKSAESKRRHKEKRKQRKLEHNQAYLLQKELQDGRG
jgi:hypothetical protein